MKYLDVLVTFLKRGGLLVVLLWTTIVGVMLVEGSCSLINALGWAIILMMVMAYVAFMQWWASKH